MAGVTQDAVLPGESYTYRFRAEQVGTFWYHTHQVSSEDVQRGLFGVLVIEPRRAARPSVFDRVLVAHTFDGIATLNGRRRRPHEIVSRARTFGSGSSTRTARCGGSP